MFGIALRGVKNNVGRYVATLVAIIVGVSFFAATGFLSARVIDSLEGDANRQYGNVDVAIVPKDESTDFAKALVIPVADAAKFRQVDGVTGGAGVLTGPVSFLDKDGSTFGDGTTGRLWITDEKLNPLEIVKGKAPTGDEIAIDQGTADKRSLGVGDTVTVLSLDGQHPAKISGITKFGSADSVDSGGTVSIPQANAFQWLRNGEKVYESYYLRGDRPQAELVKEIAPLAPSGYRVQSGDAFLADQRDKAGEIGRFLKTGLQFFAALALFVGAFVIYNTFSVIVAQRQRELAVLSAIGATPKQIKRSLRYEGLLIGLVGSALGVVVGAGLTFVLMAVLSAFGFDLPGSGIKIQPSAVFSAVLAGTLITYFSVVFPARRASRIEPIEALRDAAAETGALSRSRGIWSLALVVIGLLGLFLGSSVVAIGGGALMLVIGAIIGGPFIAVRGAHLMKPVLGRLGLEGRLAVDNSARNPKRTATTANALLIGVFLVTFVTVAGISLKDFVVAEIQKLSAADYLVNSNGGSIDPDLVQRLQDIPGVERVTPYRLQAVTLNGKPSMISTEDGGDLAKVAKLEAAEGSLKDLGPGTIAVGNTGENPPKVGSEVEVVDLEGNSTKLKVVAVLDASINAGYVGNLVTPETFNEIAGDTAPTAAFIDAKSGSESDTKDAIDNAVAKRPDITVTAGNALGEIIGGIFEFMINAVNGLLVMSVIVALIGIVNTLSLSILERRRELGLLRVMGMVDKKVQRMVRLESTLIAALGTVTGVVLGLAVGWGVVSAIGRLSDSGIPFSFPGLRVLLVLVLGVVLGLLASYIPARRSTRLEVLEAIQAT
ncbi:MAG: FtsX-like permease family protein [Acidimicrobiia bacterium]